MLFNVTARFLCKIGVAVAVILERFFYESSYDVIAVPHLNVFVC